ncbi:Ger(x)C family spore germination protein [Brevibacillus reuszeri]|uniref:Ger(x)C family spore germination protein n=1 Tax=Brevibacillus reuszeri TaxID=54915 RepID=UPI0028A1B525|nr:Ger(x)C family spore germination protein [Brevibacillus reuszeri]
MKRLRLIAVLLAISVLVSGCWNARQIENLIYINALGFDYVDNQIVVYAQVLSFSTIAKQEAGGQRENTTSIVAKATGDTVVNALFKLYPTSQQQLTWSHVRAILFHVRALNSKVFNQVIDEINRFYEFRYTLWSFATQEPIMDIFNAKQLFSRPLIYSQLEDPQDLYPQNSVMEPIQLFQFLARRSESNGVVYLPMLTTNQTVWSEDKKMLPKLKGSGACIFQNKEMKSCWSRSDLIGLRWLNKDTNRTLISVKSDDKGQALLILEKPRVRLTPFFKEGHPLFRIDVQVTGFITQIIQRGPVEALEKAAAKKIEAEIRGVYERGFKQQIDTLALGHSLYRKYPQEWKRLAKNRTLPLTSGSLDTVNIQVKLKNGGMAKVRQKQ